MELMKDLAQNLEKDIERIKDIKWAEIQASQEKEIHIDLDLDRMAAMKLGLNQVIGLIQANNINIPGGDIDLGQKNIISKPPLNTNH
jgi:multidrug efflux pump subunit AcrB